MKHIKLLYTITANHSKRTLTIRVYHNGKLSSKYRTLKLSKEDFHYYSNFATQGDIRQFLKSDEYYIVK